MSTQQREYPSQSNKTQDDAQCTITLGLIPSPQHCEKIAERIRNSLPSLLNQYVDDDVRWEIAITPDPLSGSNVQASDLMRDIHSRLEAHKWDYAICLTDLPIRRDSRIVAADVDQARNVGLVSVSALGIWHLSRRVSSLIVHITTGMRDSSSDGHDSSEAVDESLPPLSSRVLQRVIPSDTSSGTDARFLTPRLLGPLRLLLGMVYANRPWALFPGFKTTIAAAFATGGYGLIFSTLWQMGDTYGLGRLIFLSFASTTMLISWIILSHQLWEPTRSAPSRYVALLYNATTILTIASGVVFAYVVIFLLLLFAAGVFIPSGMLSETLQREVTPVDYVNIAWVTSSVATIGGAIGAGMEDSTAVQNATFGWRQVRRFRQHRKDRDGDSETD